MTHGRIDNRITFPRWLACASDTDNRENIAASIVRIGRDFCVEKKAGFRINQKRKYN